MRPEQPKYKTSDEVDFVVIGSGAAGGILAKQLSTNGFRVVLFVDFARPLRFPFHQLNAGLLSIGALAPFLREAGAKQKKWEKKFYKS